MGALNNPIIVIGIIFLALILFGRGRVANMGGELGSAIREFRRGLNGENEPTKTVATEDESKKQN
jgi:TatA/E family protein of Tat protein translocase